MVTYDYLCVADCNFNSVEIQHLSFEVAPGIQALHPFQHNWAYLPSAFAAALLTCGLDDVGHLTKLRCGRGTLTRRSLWPTPLDGVQRARKKLQPTVFSLLVGYECGLMPLDPLWELLGTSSQGHWSDKHEGGPVGHNEGRKEKH